MPSVEDFGPRFGAAFFATTFFGAAFFGADFLPLLNISMADERAATYHITEEEGTAVGAESTNAGYARNTWQ